MGALADIHGAIDDLGEQPGPFVLRMGVSAWRAFCADLIHNDLLLPDEDGPASYRGCKIFHMVAEQEDYFDGWELVKQ